jgi:FkbM family methyltransferase
MANAWGDLVILDARERLEQHMPAWIQSGRRIVIHAAGGHTRDLFVNTDFCRLNVVGIVDRNPTLHGQLIHGCTVFPVDKMPSLTPDLILVSSPVHHEEIMAGHATQWRAAGIEVVDLCEGAKPYAPLFPLALKCGLVLDDSRVGHFKITCPGNPNRTIILDSTIWEYTAHVQENFDYYFESVVPDEKTEEEWTLDVSTPGYRTLRDSGVRLFFPSLPEPDSTTEAYLSFADLKPGDVVLDLGAYAGGSTLSFSKAVGPKGLVLALEPDPKNLSALNRNIQEHHLDNVEVEAAAVWDQDGECSFQAEGCTGSSFAEVIGRDTHLVSVGTVTLGTLLARHGIDQVRFIKMDIEGSELRVLQQAMPLLQKLRPRLVVEPHRQKGVLNTSQLVALLEKGGFETRVTDQGVSDHPLIQAWWKGF